MAFTKRELGVLRNTVLKPLGGGGGGFSDTFINLNNWTYDTGVVAASNQLRITGDTVGLCAFENVHQIPASWSTITINYTVFTNNAQNYYGACLSFDATPRGTTGGDTDTQNGYYLSVSGFFTDYVRQINGGSDTTLSSFADPVSHGHNDTASWVVTFTKVGADVRVQAWRDSVSVFDVTDSASAHQGACWVGFWHKGVIGSDRSDYSNFSVSWT